MSYDIYLEIDTGGKEKAQVGDWYSPTYNLSPMFCKAFGGDGVRELSGKSGKEAARMIHKALTDMMDPDKVNDYKKLNPPNGWGDYDGAIEVLGKIMQDCISHPKATVHV